jgi:hypothetical protein
MASFTGAMREVPPDGLAPRLSRMREDGSLHSRIRAILRHRDLLAAVAERSYRHPNGFDKIVLAVGTAPKWKLRVHYWHDWSSQTMDPNIHNHRWNFASEVPLGSLEATYYDVAINEGGPLNAYRYYSPEGGSSFAFLPAGRATAVVTSVDTYRAGDSYTLAYDSFHRVRVTQLPAATLVLQGPVRRGHTLVLRDDSPPAATKLIRLRSQELAVVLEHLLLIP